jgi:beta-lactam-binding protein with PASTA domain
VIGVLGLILTGLGVYIAWLELIKNGEKGRAEEVLVDHPIDSLVEVPSVIGLLEQNAVQVITAANLTPRISATRPWAERASENGRVKHQLPEAGARLRPRNAVRLFVAGPIPMPNVLGECSTKSVRELKDLGFASVFLVPEPPGADKGVLITDQEPKPMEDVFRRTPIRLQVDLNRKCQ